MGENLSTQSNYEILLNNSKELINNTLEIIPNNYENTNFNTHKNYKILKKNNPNVENIEKVYDFSLIIPVFQEEKIIENELIKFTQELRNKYNFELIISDGGSTDQTLNIAQNYADKVITNFTNKKQTIAEGRNYGAEVANSANFVFLNIDSTPQNLDYFLQTISLWTKNKSNLNPYNAISCYVEVYNEERKLKDSIFYFILNTYFKFLNFIGIGMARGECIIIKKSIFDELNGFNSLLAAGEDFDLFYRVSKKHKTLFTKELVILESPRRFRQKGYIATLFKWFLNSIFVLYLGKSHSKDWEVIR
jgi:glycosyltransferase involved in cell wall biosynthesis